MVGAREREVHKQEQGAVYEQEVPGAHVAGAEVTASLDWGSRADASPHKLECCID